MFFNRLLKESHGILPVSQTVIGHSHLAPRNVARAGERKQGIQGLLRLRFFFRCGIGPAQDAKGIRNLPIEFRRRRVFR
jgi:hypothetical protein